MKQFIKIADNIYRYRSGSGFRYRVRYYSCGVVYDRVFKSYDEAVIYLKNIRSDVDFYGDISLSDLVLKYQAWRSLRVAPTTLYSDGLILFKLVKVLGNKRYMSYGYGDYERLVNYLLSCDSCLSSKNRFFVVLRCLDNYAFDKLGLSSGFRGRLDNLRKADCRISTVKRKYISVDEVVKLISFTLDPFYRLMFLMMYYQGLRVEEIRGLRVSDVDRINCTINLCRAISSKTGVGHYVVIDNKTVNSKRSLVFPDFVFDKILLRIAILNDDSYIFSLNGGVAPVSDHSIRLALARSSVASGVVDVYPHLFRHAVACHLFERGYSPDEIAKYLGHSSGIVTKMYYIHLSNENKKRMSRDVEDITKELSKMV